MLLNENVTETPTEKGRPILAWIVIAATIALILFRYDKQEPQEREVYDLLTIRLQARYLLGLSTWAEQFSSGEALSKSRLYQEAQTQNRGSFSQRLRFVVLAGELDGPSEALSQLHKLNQQYRTARGEPSEQDAETAKLLERLYEQREKNPSSRLEIAQADQKQLRERLGWFGELALHPASENDAERDAILRTAQRTALSLLLGSFTLLGTGLLGLVLLVIAFIWWLLHRLTGGLTVGRTHGNLYFETFAVYMVLFMGLSYAVRFAFRWMNASPDALVLSGIAALGSLAALSWPVLRGIPWRQVRLDIGWISGRGTWRELLLGFGSYAMALPLLGIAVVAILLLTKLRDRLGWGPDEFGPSGNPAHPIILWAENARWWVWLEVLFLASVVAPLVEETMFRGVLYRSMRESTRRLRPATSVLVSALVVSFVFAVIHPQGILGIPALMALAFAFALIREWRVTLLPAMIAHGVNNAVATLLLFSMMQ